HGSEWSSRTSGSPEWGIVLESVGQKNDVWLMARASACREHCPCFDHAGARRSFRTKETWRRIRSNTIDRGARCRTLIRPSFARRNQCKLRFCKFIGIGDGAIPVLIASLETDDPNLIDRIGKVDEEFRGCTRGLHLGVTGDSCTAITQHAIRLIDCQHAIEFARLIVIPAEALRFGGAHAGRSC